MNLIKRIFGGGEEKKPVERMVGAEPVQTAAETEKIRDAMEAEMNEARATREAKTAEGSN